VAPTGEGVAHDDGGAVLVAGTLAGEQVVADVGEARAGLARATLVEVLKANSARVEPACPWARRCGGCELMHAGVEAQRDIHRDIVVESLQRALPDVQLPEARVHAPDAALGYRNRARLLVEASRGGVAVGYRGSRSHDLVPIERCAVLRPELQRGADQLGELLQDSRGQGDVQLALGLDAAPVLEVRWRGNLAAQVFERADRRVRDQRLAGVRLWTEGALAPAVFGDPRPRVPAADGEPLWIAPAGFAQPSDAGGVELARRVAELAGEVGRVVELFAGSGTLTVALAPRSPASAPYLAVEQDEHAVSTLRDNMTERELQVRVRQADANDVAISSSTVTAVLDPPRAGAAGACRAIAEARPRQVIYVSCNPATLARDLTTLSEAGYAPSDVELFELFPQTSHVETVVRLVRSGRARRNQ